MSILPPTSKTFQHAASLLKRGDLVAFPTETVYGLGCDTFNPEAIAKVYALKGRPANNPTIAHILDTHWVPLLTDAWCDRCEQLTEHFWPGPLTIVVPKKDTVPQAACGGKSTIAIRCPAHPVAREVMDCFGGPISAPSANVSGYISPTTAEHVMNEFGDQLCIVDGGPCSEGIESTVLSLVDTPVLLRPGTITKQQLEDCLGGIEYSKATTQNQSPGSSLHHYAPHTPTKLCSKEEIQRVNDEETVVVSLYSNPIKAHACVSMPTNPQHYATELYAVLRKADNASASRICIEKPPKLPEWVAVLDRLHRCASASYGS